MGIFGSSKKKTWDENRSNENKDRMKDLFNQSISESDTYKIVYGFGLNIKNSNYIVMRKTTYQYTSLIIGYRKSDMSIVLLQTTPELEGVSEPEYFNKESIKKSKIATGEYTIYHKGGLMAGYTQFSVIAENDEKYLVYCHQEEEQKEFHEFWKEFCKK